MAFRSQDNAYTLWHPAERRPLLRSHRTLRTDPARILLGIYGWIALAFTGKVKSEQSRVKNPLALGRMPNLN